MLGDLIDRINSRPIDKVDVRERTQKLSMAVQSIDLVCIKLAIQDDFDLPQQSMSKFIMGILVVGIRFSFFQHSIFELVIIR